METRARRGWPRGRRVSGVVHARSVRVPLGSGVGARKADMVRRWDGGSAGARARERDLGEEGRSATLGGLGVAPSLCVK